MEQYKATIEKLVFGGQGLAHVDGRTVFLWNALPGEEVEFEITKKRRGIIEGVATRIIVPSPDRIMPHEDHFLSCSPWQILNQKKENYWKLEITKEIYKKIAPKDILDKLQIEVDESAQYGYRNKIEFSFDQQEELASLAFFERSTKRHIKIKECLLANAEINKTAQEILAWINKEKIPARKIKSLILRSNTANEVIAALFIKEPLTFENYLSLENNFKGFEIYYSDPQSPAAVPTMLLYSLGQNYLEENILGLKFKYGIFSFFQVNGPLFSRALTDISNFVDRGDQLVDFYSGVGAIGLSLASKCQHILIVDSSNNSVEYAKENIVLNKILNAETVLSPAEKVSNFIEKEKTIIFDPPRAGLHPKIIKKILENKPKTIIYLSCNASTQARDIGQILGPYKMNFMKIYNFFPRTPHIESLVILTNV